MLEDGSMVVLLPYTTTRVQIDLEVECGWAAMLNGERCFVLFP